ncbi:hypothetical protein OG921_15840 [Aldersonia sp. NBC_00410]|uniref:hypothetical protein n=1 Tax=Aldersonia sp. NBC_00410 TaxID=2975954 RepID=UPI00224DCBEF|nr:hypothetical protein [Aldersonia sp. NBC_00410]MCX5044641.1 hypothetical protein [Aldersonia sp. NBC_00410]
MPSKAAFYKARSAVGNLTQSRSADDPVLIEAQRRMAEESFLIAVSKAIDKAPPVTPELRRRVVDLLAVITGAIA